MKVDIELKTGVISETVNIPADAASLQASSATVQGLVNERTVTQAFVDNTTNQNDPVLKTLKVGNLQDTANTFGTYRQNTYDGRQIELVAKFRF